MLRDWNDKDEEDLGDDKDSLVLISVNRFQIVLGNECGIQGSGRGGE